MNQKPVIPGGLVQVPPTRLVLPGGYTQSPLRPVLPGGVAQVSVGTSFVGPLDAYTAGLLGAWSVSRRLLSSWVGSAFLLRRASDDTTLAIGFTEAGLVDEAAVLGFCGGGDGFVVRAYDQSSNGRDWTQTVEPLNQPKIVAAGALITFGGANRVAMECIGAGTGMTADMGASQTPDALTYAFAGVALNGCYNGQVGNPTASYAAGGAILLYSPAATTVQNYVAGSVRGNGLTITSGEEILAGVECGPANVTHYRDGVANTPAAYDPTFGFSEFGLWTTGSVVAGDGAAGAQMAEAVLWAGARGASLAAFQANQLTYFGL